MTHEQAEKMLQLLTEINLKLGKLTGDTVQVPLTTPAPIAIPYQQPQMGIFSPCPMGGYHEFPQVWMGITPPPCNKCHQSFPNPFVVTCTTGQEAQITPGSTLLATDSPGATNCSDSNKFCSDCSCGKKEKFLSRVK